MSLNEPGHVSCKKHVVYSSCNVLQSTWRPWPQAEFFLGFPFRVCWHPRARHWRLSDCPGQPQARSKQLKLGSSLPVWTSCPLVRTLLQAVFTVFLSLYELATAICLHQSAPCLIGVRTLKRTRNKNMF